MDAIVCDTSSLIRLYKSDTLHLLSQGFERIWIPEPVWHECSAALQDALNVNAFVRASPSADIVGKYGQGERAMLNLALELGVQYVLTDDDKASNEAVRLNLIALAALDLLVILKRLGAPLSVRVAVERMRAARERIDESAVRQALTDAGEA